MMVGHLFVEIVKLFRDELPEVTIEILVPDFQGKWDSIDRVAAGPPCF